MASTSPDVTQSLEQLKTVWRLCVEDRGSGEVRDDAALAIRWADNEFPFWNAVANAVANTGAGTTRDDFDAVLNGAADYLRGRRQPGFLWLFEDLLDTGARQALPDAADQAGLSLALSGHCMVGDILPLAEEPHHPDLRFVRVGTEAEVMAYAEVNCRAYGFNPAAARPGFAGSRLWTGEIHAFLGLKDGVPVTAGGAVAADGCLFVILIATLPEHQRKGYGEAVTRRALYEGGRATGLRRVQPPRGDPGEMSVCGWPGCGWPGWG